MAESEVINIEYIDIVLLPANACRTDLRLCIKYVYIEQK
jgi:hypothetical protein